MMVFFLLGVQFRTLGVSQRKATMKQGGGGEGGGGGGGGGGGAWLAISAPLRQHGTVFRAS